MTQKKTLNVGIIGYGRIGKLRAKLAQAHPHMQVVGISDAQPLTPQARKGFRFFGKPEQLLKEKPDAVFVCTPNRFTSFYVVQALDQGIHVFSEKPPGRDPQDVANIIQAEKRNPSCKLKFGFNHRYHDGIREAKAIVDGKSLGRVLWMRGVYGKSGGIGFEKGWRSDREMAGGGILLDQGIHMLDLFSYFCGEFTEVQSCVSNAYWNLDVEDNAFALLRNRNDQVAMIHSSSTHWRHTFLLEIYLTDGYVAVKGILSGSRSYGRETLITARREFDSDSFAVGNPREEVTYFDRDTSWEKEMDEFARCVLQNKPVEVGTSDQAQYAMDLVYRIYKGDPKWWNNHYREKKKG